MTNPDEVAAYVIGTCNSEYAVARYFNIDENDVADVCLNARVPVERCSKCAWWVESGECLDEQGEPAPCESCQEDDK